MKCSVIIPARNSERTITLCLGSVLAQSFSGEDYEVILVDDGSTDNTAKIAESYPVKIVRQRKRGPAAARNRGAIEAEGDILIFTDSDCELDFNFLEKITTAFSQNPEIAGVQGSYKTKQTEFMARFVQAEIETRYKRMERDRYIDFIGTYAAAYRKDIFHKYGGFDAGFPLPSGEDAEFSYKLHQQGCKLIFKREAFVYHQHPVSLRHYLKSKFYRGYWRIRLYRKHFKKIIMDSYTPQSLKLQVLSLALFPVLVVMTIYNKFWLLPLFFMAVSFCFFSIPFFKLLERSAISVKILIPFVLFLRAAALLFGMLWGTISELRMGKKERLLKSSLLFCILPSTIFWLRPPTFLA